MLKHDQIDSPFTILHWAHLSVRSYDAVNLLLEIALTLEPNNRSEEAEGS